MISVRSENGQIDTIMISDIGGKLIYTNHQVETTSTVIDISTFSDGMYFITINNTLTKKIIKR